MRGLVLGLMACAATGASAQLMNPSFEAAGPDFAMPFDFWSSFNNSIPNILQESLAPLSGSFGGKMFGPFNEDPPGTPVSGDTGIVQEVLASPGQWYEASVWAAQLSSDALQGDNAGFLSVVFLDQFSNVLGDVATTTITPSTAPDVYSQYKVTAQAPAGTFIAQIVIGMFQGATANRGGSIYFDDAGLANVPPPSQVIVGADGSTAPWLGFMNVFNLPQDGGGYQFGSPWGVGDLVAVFDDGAGTLTLAPNTIGDPDPYWYIGGGAPGAQGNKIMEANLYQEVTDTLSGQLVTFEGTILADTFTSEHDAFIFIRDFAPNYATFNQTIVPATVGDFSISLSTVAGAGRHVQWGFQVRGPNVWVTDVAPFGSVVVRTGDGADCPADLSPPPGGDGDVNTNDFFQFLSYYQAQDLNADFSPPGGDGMVNTNDFFAFLAAYQQGC